MLPIICHPSGARKRDATRTTKFCAANRRPVESLSRDPLDCTRTSAVAAGPRSNPEILHLSKPFVLTFNSNARRIVTSLYIYVQFYRLDKRKCKTGEIAVLGEGVMLYQRRRCKVNPFVVSTANMDWLDYARIVNGEECALP